MQPMWRTVPPSVTLLSQRITEWLISPQRKHSFRIRRSALAPTPDSSQKAYCLPQRQASLTVVHELAEVVMTGEFRSTRDVIIRSRHWERALEFYGSVLSLPVVYRS